MRYFKKVWIAKDRYVLVVANKNKGIIEIDHTSSSELMNMLRGQQINSKETLNQIKDYYENI